MPLLSKKQVLLCSLPTIHRTKEEQLKQETRELNMNSTHHDSRSGGAPSKASCCCFSCGTYIERQTSPDVKLSARLHLAGGGLLLLCLGLRCVGRESLIRWVGKREPILLSVSTSTASVQSGRNRSVKLHLSTGSPLTLMLCKRACR